MKNRENRVRISDIAEELGVSTATVSNVIHGKTKKMSEATARRVQAVLEERQYIPGVAEMLLAQNNSKIIGVIVHNHEKYEGHVLEDGFVAASLNALAEEIDRAGYFMMVKVTKKWGEIPRFASMWNMAGLVLVGFCEMDYQRLRDNMRIPFVTYDGFLQDGHGLVNLVIDHFDGGRQMGSYLKKLGHRCVLCVADNDQDVDHQRYLGLKSVFPEAELLVVPMQKQERMVFYRQYREYLLGFTAIFAVSDYYAVDLIQFLISEGIPVPEQMSVAGFDDSLISRQLEPQLTTIGQDYTARARLTMELLEKLRNQEKAALSYTLPLTLIARKSTGRLF